MANTGIQLYKHNAYRALLYLNLTKHIKLWRSRDVQEDATHQKVCYISRVTYT